LGVGSSRALIWVLKASGQHGAQFWGPVLICVGMTVIFVALIAHYAVHYGSGAQDAQLL
jgi:hypothetical protein